MGVGMTDLGHDAFALADDLRRRYADRPAILAIIDLHQPQLTILDSVIENGQERAVATDSAEEILGREVVCLACATYPNSPCPTLRALAVAP